jgi:hypothetical protein
MHSGISGSHPIEARSSTRALLVPTNSDAKRIHNGLRRNAGKREIRREGGEWCHSVSAGSVAISAGEPNSKVHHVLY